MDGEDDNEPVVHRVRTDYDERKEAQMGLDQLLARGRAELSRDARERAAAKSEDELESVRQARLKKAQAIADRFAWKPVAAVALFETQTCLHCGKTHNIFRGFGTLYQQKSNFAERWEKADCLDRGLPYQQRGIASTAPTCVDCIQEFSADRRQAQYEFHPSRRTDD